MENYKDIVNKINLIIEQSNSENPKCKNCVSHCDGACTFGCINERNMGRYMFSQRKLTSPEVRLALYNAIISDNYEIAPPHQAQIPKDNGDMRIVYVNENIDRIFLSIVNNLFFEMFPEFVHNF